MNITYLIGNGFDLSIGLNTRYSDFYTYYLSLKEKKYPKGSEIIVKELQKYLDNPDKQKDILWRDLERALGKISSEFENPEEFENVILDLNEELRKYIEMQDNTKKAFQDELCDLFKRDLINPYQYLTPAERVLLMNFRNKRSNRQSISIISFNYTRTIEKLVQFKSKPLVLPKTGTYDNTLEDIRHIHGMCSSTILMGVDNENQIANENFRKNEDLLDILVKPKSNEAIGSEEEKAV